MGDVFVRQLYELGFAPGVKVKVVSLGFRGPVLVEVRGQGLLLGGEQP
ncbi:MAG: FeoA domain-containing protein [Candidatus Heimdallarchaeota archaeon]